MALRARRDGGEEQQRGAGRRAAPSDWTAWEPLHASLTQARWRAALRAELATSAGTKPRDGFCLCEQEIREGGKTTTLQGGRMDDEWRRETGGGETLKKRLEAAWEVNPHG